LNVAAGEERSSQSGGNNAPKANERQRLLISNATAQLVNIFSGSLPIFKKKILKKNRLHVICGKIVNNINPTSKRERGIDRKKEVARGGDPIACPKWAYTFPTEI